MTKLKNLLNKNLNLFIIIYALGLFALNFIRIFDGNFWLDETYSIDIVHLSLPDMIRTTASDVHPPLYYLILRIVSKIFGGQDFSYHLVSIIPYAIILVFAVTKINKTFGKIPAAFLITFSSLLTTSLRYNVEVRMYAWGTLFALLSFYNLYQIFATDKKSSYIFFVITSLCAAYTHYFLLITMAGLYAVLLIATLIKRKSSFKKVLYTYLFTIIGYTPWLVVLLKTMKKTSEGFWMTDIPSFKDCLLSFFAGRLQIILIFVLVICTAVVLLFDTEILKFENDDNNKKKLSFSLKRMTLSFLSWWIIAGYIALFATILFGLGVSYIIRPMFLIKYAYPSTILVWLILGVCISKLKFSRVIAAVLLLAILATGLLSYVSVYKEDRATLKLSTETLSKTTSLITEDDVILAEERHFEDGVANYYYGTKDCRTITASGDNFETLEQSKKYWLFLSDTITDELTAELQSQGFGYNTVVEDGNVGTYRVFIYELTTK